MKHKFLTGILSLTVALSLLSVSACTTIGDHDPTIDTDDPIITPGDPDGNTPSGGNENPDDDTPEESVPDNSSDGLEFMITEDDPFVCFVTGIGSCTDTKLVIPNFYNGFPVEGINDYAFKGNTTITSVTLPSSIIAIGNGAFSDCINLSEIRIQSEECVISENAFSNTAYYNDNSHWDNGVFYVDDCLICADQSLTGSYTVREGTRIIANSAFADCTNLTDIHLPDGLTSIGFTAFSNTGHANNAENWENNVLYIDTYAICARQELSGSYLIKDGTTLIAMHAFVDCNVTEIIIPDSVEHIGLGAFMNCERLKNVTLPNNLRSISYGTFFGCFQLTDIAIPTSVLLIQTLAFGSCSQLANIDIPENVRLIGRSVFSSTHITALFIPKNVSYIGDLAFTYCNNLAEIQVDPNNINYTSIDGVLFNKTQTKLIQYPAGKQNTSYAVPESVSALGNYAFACNAYLASVTIPDTVNNIGISAFYCCTSLTDINIPDGITSIQEGSFYNCSSLTTISIPESVIIIGDNAFGCCWDLSYVTIPDQVTTIGAYAFNQCNLTSITIPNSVTTIGISAFAACMELTSVTFSNTVGWTVDGQPIDVTDPNTNANKLKVSSFMWLRQA